MNLVPRPGFEGKSNALALGQFRSPVEANVPLAGNLVGPRQHPDRMSVGERVSRRRPGLAKKAQPLRP